MKFITIGTHHSYSTVRAGVVFVSHGESFTRDDILLPVLIPLFIDVDVLNTVDLVDMIFKITLTLTLEGTLITSHHKTLFQLIRDVIKASIEFVVFRFSGMRVILILLGIFIWVFSFPGLLEFPALNDHLAVQLKGEL